MSEDIRVIRGKPVAAYTFWLPCGRCKEKRDTAACTIAEDGLNHTVRLCEECLSKMIYAIRVPEGEDE